MSGEIIEKINGFPNRLFGWGGEDDDIYARCVVVILKYKLYKLL